jgi:hypothetical protein
MCGSTQAEGMHSCGQQSKDTGAEIEYDSSGRPVAPKESLALEGLVFFARITYHVRIIDHDVTKHL